jgi:hypothetical protein
MMANHLVKITRSQSLLVAPRRVSPSASPSPFSDMFSAPQDMTHCCPLWLHLASTNVPADNSNWADQSHAPALYSHYRRRTRPTRLLRSRNVQPRHLGPRVLRCLLYEVQTPLEESTNSDRRSDRHSDCQSNRCSFSYSFYFRLV